VVLVAGDCFPSLHFLLTGLAERYGFELRTVQLRDGAHWVEDEDVIAAWGPEVGLALLTWVSSTSSHRCDLEALVAHGRSKGSLIGVDITQAAGLIDYDCMAVAADFAISTSLKWMCGSPGGGILQVMPDVIARCQPSLRGWFSQENIFSWDINAFAYAPDIRRFDNGTPSVMACVASVPALEWHAAQDWGQQLAKNRSLSEAIITAADEAGLELASPRNAAQRGAWRRPGRPLFRDLDEAARSVARGRRDRAQQARRHLRLGRGAVGRDARQPGRQRPESAEAIREHFAYWDDIAVVHKGQRIVSTGTASAASGASRC
jgi:kynureninase